MQQKIRGSNGTIDEDIDDVVNQILERRSARLSGNPVPEVGAGKGQSEVRVKVLPQLQSRQSILRSLDLECSAVPLGDPVLSAKECGYVSPFSSAATPDDLSPPYLGDERKHLWQHLNDLENAVKALDAPSMDYSELSCDDTYADDVEDALPKPGSVSRGLPTLVLEADSLEAVIQFRGEDLAAMDTSLLHGRTSDPYLVFLQKGKEITKTEVVNHNLNPVWKPLKLVFLDRWTPVLVQCWDKDTLTQDDLIGKNEVPVQDLLTKDREIHLMCKGKSSGKITVVSVSTAPTATSQASQPSPQNTVSGTIATKPVSSQADDCGAASWKLKVSLKSAQHLPKMDTFGTCDAYVVMTVGDNKIFKSATIKGSYSPVWNETFEFELDVADNSKALVLSVYDWDRV